MKHKKSIPSSQLFRQCKSSASFPFQALVMSVKRSTANEKEKQMLKIPSNVHKSNRQAGEENDVTSPSST